MQANRWSRTEFDSWAHLARSDPEAFEARRAALIEETISRAPAHHQEHLRRLQWRVDGIRRRTHNPLVACSRIYGLMWDSFAGPGGLVETLQGRSAPAPAPRREATVLSFPGHRRDA